MELFVLIVVLCVAENLHSRSESLNLISAALYTKRELNELCVQNILARLSLELDRVLCEALKNPFNY